MFTNLKSFETNDDNVDCNFLFKMRSLNLLRINQTPFIKYFDDIYNEC